MRLAAEMEYLVWVTMKTCFALVLRSPYYGSPSRCKSLLNLISQLSQAKCARASMNTFINTHSRVCMNGHACGEHVRTCAVESASSELFRIKDLAEMYTPDSSQGGLPMLQRLHPMFMLHA